MVRGIRVRTHAKINLFLRVLARRPDGYHEIETVFHGVRLGDDLEVRAQGSSGCDVHMELADGLPGSPPREEENVITHAAGCLSGRVRNPTGVSVRVVKRVPLAAGLGGGSGNAAGVLLTLNEIWAGGLGRPELLEVALQVGSDVPYCLSGGTALATARGEKLTPLPSLCNMWFVLGISDEPLLTRDVYAAWDDLQPLDEVRSAPMAMALGAGDVAEVASLLHNDLERAAFLLAPGLAEKKGRLLDEGALGACVSGSGPTVFGIARDELHARAIAEKVDKDFAGVGVVPSQQVCVERLS
ncbi:MAG: 4-(cytidine 5'-diphospho)-2-C-methyl-D-erythritol kinase [Actinomycetota bacterium]|nr:4-(cytidine 5'-diphospho)-2-C-methyl-D-erythritol kinase [Actinomycetota bacterium]